ncbi:MAG TPA: hypothetical protein VIC26_04150 [Marinagarivorans sp.]
MLDVLITGLRHYLLNPLRLRVSQRRATRLQLACLLMAFGTGCTQVVHVPHTDIAAAPSINTGIDTKILIQPSSVAHQQQYEESGLFVVGLLNSWQVDFNTTLPDAVKDVIEQTYQSADIGTRCDDCGLIVRPRITQIDIEKLSMQASVEVRLEVLDARGNKITTLNSGGRSSFMSASRLGAGIAGYFIPLLGTAVGTHVVKETVQEALDEALADLAEQIEYHANGGALARTWLPKNYHQQKRHGRHEYTAERVARAAGCNMFTDAINLTDQQYYQETYSAHCWGKPVFTIACEFGRCEILDEGRLADGHSHPAKP